jgi:uncharacterized protein (DUF1684 family)
MKYLFNRSVFIFSILLIGCSESFNEKGSTEYISSIKKWNETRLENLKKEDGWLNLVGLYWLKEGENKFGSDKSNDIVFPEKNAEKFMGSFFLKDSVITLIVNQGVIIKTENSVVEKMKLRYDLQGNPSVLEYESLRWFIIKRGDKYGVRLRDLEADLVRSFSGIETFPINEDWRIEAKFDEYKPPKEIEIPNILGTIEKEKSPGAILFMKGSKEYKLDVTDAGNSYFIVFADLTSGNETYGAGRFLYVDKPDSSGEIYIDFNKAYNPPCAFTKYATCPLPPKQNHLKLEITAGEKNFVGGVDHK